VRGGTQGEDFSPVLTKETVFYKGKQHVQFNSMYVCTLKVAGERHGITAQAQRGEIIDLGFLGSQNSASIGRGGGGGDGENAARGGNRRGGGWTRVWTRRRRGRRSRKYSNLHRILFQQHNNILENIIIPSTSLHT
jgi:hypothetical protein